MAYISITNATILNSETADVTKLTTNDNDIVSALTEGAKDIKVAGVEATSLTLAGTTALSNYTEGTYTPSITLVGGTGNTTPTYTTKTGRYSRIGRTVYVSIKLSNTTGGTAGAGTGAVTISLPVNASSSYSMSVCPIGYASNSTTSYQIAGNINASASVINLSKWTDWDNFSDFPGSGQDNASRVVQVQFWYEV